MARQLPHVHVLTIDGYTCLKQSMFYKYDEICISLALAGLLTM